MAAGIGSLVVTALLLQVINYFGHISVLCFFGALHRVFQQYMNMACQLFATLVLKFTVL